MATNMNTKRGLEDNLNSYRSTQQSVLPTKRHRLSTLESPPAHQGLIHNTSVHSRYAPNPDSAFNIIIPQEPTENNLDKGMCRQARQRGHEYLKAQGKAGTMEDPLMFSLDQVKAVVARAVDEREGKLRTRFDAIFQEKLEEQYMSFTKFNASNIKRQMRESQYD
eukprot:Ihof_evm2s416 gene=Ihof_evmTU2s416